MTVKIMDIFEKMSASRINYWGEFVFDAAVAIALFGYGVTQSAMGWLTVIALSIGGLLLFSFIEYFFHRWLFHAWVPSMIRGHQKHHDAPLGYDSLPFFVPSLVFFGVMVLFQFVMPLAYACILASMVAVGYMTYGLTHFAMHHFRFNNIIAKKLVALHAIHHHHPDHNYGVTSPLWDIILGTKYKSEHKRMW